MSGKLFVISAPSGAGKTTLVKAVLEKFDSELSIGRVVTFTSRAPRTGEIPGQDYHFISSGKFEQNIKNNFFLEWSGEYGNYYGTPRSVVDELFNGFSRVLIIDMLGAHNIVAVSNDDTPILTNSVVPIWIYTSTIAQLKDRLIGRGKNTIEQIERRLELAKHELKREKEGSLYRYKLLNDDFFQAVSKLHDLIVYELSKEAF